MDFVCNATSYKHRVDNGDAYNWCIVQDRGWDAILFGGVAVAISCLFNGKLASLMVLIMGGILMSIAWPVNLLELGNSIAIWLSMSPWDLFFYIFLPPLVLEGGMRMDWFTFKKVIVPVVIMAFLVVSAACGLMIPIMLYMFDMKREGWTWADAAMFGAMVGPTDAVVILTIMRSSGCSRVLKVLIDGESLLNDASTITLFIVFFERVRRITMHINDDLSAVALFGDIVLTMIKLAAIGFGIGLGFAIAMRELLRWLRKWGAGQDQQIALTLATVYLVFYVANWPAQGSGVVAVAVFGLFGAATSYWDLSPDLEESGAFEAFYSTLCYTANGIVFFYSGVAIMNFFIRSYRDMDASSIATAIWRLPLLYLMFHILRFVLLGLFWPFYKLSGTTVSVGELAFMTVAGLRGSVSLIMAQAVVRGDSPYVNGKEVVRSQMVFWTSGYVIMTLLINAPLLPLALKVTGLAGISEDHLAQRRRARDALLTYTQWAVGHLKKDQDELLTGVDWSEVEEYVDLASSLEQFVDPGNRKVSKLGNVLASCWRGVLQCCRCCVSRGPPPSEGLPGPGLHTGRASLVRSHSMVAYLGRPTPWLSSQPQGGTTGDPRLNTMSTDVLDEQLLSIQGEEDAVQWELPFVKRQHSVKQSQEVLSKEDPHNGTKAEQLLTRSSDVKGNHWRSTPQDGKPQREMEVVSGGVLGEVTVDMVNLQGKQELEGDEVLMRSSSQSYPSTSLDGRYVSAYEDTAIGGCSVGPGSASPFGQDGVTTGLRQEVQERDKEQVLRKLSPPLRTVRGLSSELKPAGEVWPTPPMVQRPPSLAKRSAPPSSTLERALSRPEIVQDVFSRSLSRRSGSLAMPQKLANLAMKYDDPLVMDETTGGSPEGGLGHSKSLGKLSDLDGLPTGPPLLGQKSLPGRGPYDRLALADPKGIKESLFGPQTSLTHNRTVQGDRSAAVGRPSLSLGGSSSNIREGLDVEVDPKELARARLWMLAGIRRYFHSKRMQGLLSGEGLRILDHACEEAMDQPHQPINLWEVLERNTCGGMLLKTEAQISFTLRKLVIAVQNPQVPPIIARVVLSPFRVVNSFLNMRLTKVMLLSCEVAMEYFLGLTSSPYVQWLQGSEVWGALLKEIELEGMRAWHFLIEREIEAPQRFSAIQSYRATLAVIRQQKKYVADLFESGMIGQAEHGMMNEPIEAKKRKLEHRGPVWKAPGVTKVIKRLPFMRQMPDSVVKLFLGKGRLVMVAKGMVLPFNQGSKQQDGSLATISQRSGVRLRRSASLGSAQGEGMDRTSVPDTQGALFVVISGIMKVIYEPSTGATQEYILGVGGMLGLYSALTGQSLPGNMKAIAQGNALGRGPVLFKLSAEGIGILKRLAEAGDHTYEQLELDMSRVAGLYLVERLKPLTTVHLVRSLKNLAPQRGPSDGFGDHQTSAAGFSVPPGDLLPEYPEAGSPTWHKTLGQHHNLQWAKKRAADIMSEFKQQLHVATLVSVAAGNRMVQREHMLLLSGSLDGLQEAMESVAQVPLKPALGPQDKGAFPPLNGPCLMPWIWSALSVEDCQSAGISSHQMVIWQAGPQGALLLRCGTHSSEVHRASVVLPGIMRSHSARLRTPSGVDLHHMASPPTGRVASVSALPSESTFLPLEGAEDLSEMCHPGPFLSKA